MNYITENDCISELVLVIRSKNLTLITQLIEGGYDVNKAHYDNLVVKKPFLSHDGITTGYGDKTYAIHEAISKNLCEVVSLLLKHNADINYKNENNYTALHLSLQVGCDKCVSLLMDHIENNKQITS